MDDKPRRSLGVCALVSSSWLSTAAAIPQTTSDRRVALRPQETDMWCWAASGEMIMEFLGVQVQQETRRTRIRSHRLSQQPSSLSLRSGRLA
jgi:hypothetical protein